MGFFPSGSLKQKTQFHANHMSSRLFARWEIAKYIRAVSSRSQEIIEGRRNRECKCSLLAMKSRESVRREKSMRRTEEEKETKRKQRIKEKEGGDEKKRRTTKTGRGGEEKVSTSRATFIPFTSLPARAIDEEQRGRPRRREGRAHESKTVAVYGRFYGVTHRGTTVLLLSILAIEIGCLLIGICLSREPLMIPWVGRVWRRALHIAPTFTRDTMELVHAAALHRAVRTNRVFNTFGTAQDLK